MTEGRASRRGERHRRGRRPGRPSSGGPGPPAAPMPTRLQAAYPSVAIPAPSLSPAHGDLQLQFQLHTAILFIFRSCLLPKSKNIFYQGVTTYSFF